MINLQNMQFCSIRKHTVYKQFQNCETSDFAKLNLS